MGKEAEENRSGSIKGMVELGKYCLEGDIGQKPERARKLVL